MNSTDKICSKYSNKRVRFRTTRLKGGFVLVEGNAKALEFLGKLFLAQSKDKQSCSSHLSPKGAGLAFFKKGSTLGLYIHRLPCLEKNGGPIRK